MSLKQFVQRSEIFNLYQRFLRLGRLLHDHPNRASPEKDDVDDLGRRGLLISQTNEPSSTDFWAKKILYSSYLQDHQHRKPFRRRIAERAQKPYIEAVDRVGKTLTRPPIAWKYLYDDEHPKDAEDNYNATGFDSHEEESTNIHFPFKNVSHTEFISDENSHASARDASDSTDVQHISENPRETNPHSTTMYKSEFEKLGQAGLDLAELLRPQGSSDEDELKRAALGVLQEYGTEDHRIRPSDVPCGGCGAHLHCNDSSIPGYTPSERFRRFNRDTLRGEICLRCFSLQNYNTAINVNVSPEDYPKLLRKIEDHFAMVLLLVDLTDFPCSIWPGISEIIGTKRPVFLVGNKVDLLPQDSEKYLSRIEKCLSNAANEAGLYRSKIIHTALISATTGFGVEGLITKIHQLWGTKGDIFIMGCTNVGKSSLFNALIQSDLCKNQVTDLVRRATISQWPGTTLNLLKFPIMRVTAWRLATRYNRLRDESQLRKIERMEQISLLRQTRSIEHATLVGNIGRTFINDEKYEASKDAISGPDPFLHSKYVPRNIPQVGQWDPDDNSLQGKWCFDTPGVVNDNQILSLLTLPELMKTLPKKLIEPRTYFIKLGMTLFVGGLARIDYIEGLKPIRYTVFTSQQIPITIVLTEDADDFYRKALGSPILGVPEGGKERLSKFPPLLPTEFTMEGEGHDYSCGDIVLSSAGWVAVSVGIGKACTLRLHSPGGKGIVFRQPAMLPLCVNFKGPRIRDTLTYNRHKIFFPQKNLKH